MKKFRCKVCGKVFESNEENPICPVCLHPQAYFELADHDNF